MGSTDVLEAWRWKATDVLLIICAVVLAPVLVLGFLGYGIPVPLGIKVSGFVAYLAILAGALARRVDYRIRVWVTVGAGYLFALLGSAALPHAPFLRSLPLEHAIFVLVLTGQKSGRVATLISIGVLLLTPVLHTMPIFAPVLVMHTTAPPTPLDQLMVQSINLTVLLIGIILLLERFHAMLLHTLAAQRQATEELRWESAERATALRALEHASAERQRLERELARISDDERRRLGQDVHDGVCQQLTGALLRCQAMERKLNRADTLAPADLHALSSLLEDAIDEAHAVAQGLQPLAPEPDALARALRSMAKKTRQAAGITCQYTADGDTAVADPVIAQHLYRIAQEAVNNAVRHAQARQIQIGLSSADNHISLQVEDDGCGLSATTASSGMGMRTMAFRAEIIGGTLDIASLSPCGVRVTCRVPAPASAAKGEEVHVH